MIREQKSNAVIEVDGGVDLSNIRKLVNTGVDVLVVGSYIFRSENPTETISKLKNA